MSILTPQQEGKLLSVFIQLSPLIGGGNVFIEDINMDMAEYVMLHDIFEYSHDEIAFMQSQNDE